MRINIIIDPKNRQRDGLATISFRIPTSGQQVQADISFKNLFERCGIPDPIALDFLLFSSVIYAVDKNVARSGTPDNWTREVELNFPVSNPEIWETAARRLEECLSFVSGDVWKLTFERMSGRVFNLPPRRLASIMSRRSLKRSGADSVCLFSGGLDSLTGAIDLIGSGASKRLLLVGHYDAPGPASTQDALWNIIKSNFPLQTDLVQVRVSHRPQAADESSQRTRSLVFMGLGIYAARSLGANTPLYAPENGLIAINIPLTPSRSGSCSTRTMHPFFLTELEAALHSLGITNSIINPFELKTKGECISECRDPNLLHSLIDRSVSCAHPSRRQEWVRREAGNCGYCVPCIFRRAALHRAGLDDGQKYGMDFCAGELSANDPRDCASDLRAVLDFLLKRKSVEDLRREILRVAPVHMHLERADMALRGFDEIRSLIRDKGVPSLRRAVMI